MFIDHTGITYQPPPPCPANYIPRLEIINEISKVIVDNSSDDPTVCIGTTVTIRGIGGIGKSTLAKALCYHPPVKKYFIHGFLWISLTPPHLSPEAILRDVYNKLTNNSITCSYSLLKDKIRLLLSSFSCKLLVIFDDVVDADDVTEYLEVFSSCKTVLTTRKNDIDITIPSIKCFNICPMKIFEAVQLMTWRIASLATLSVSDADRIQELARDLYYWPLLLNLVRGQLYVHCTARKQSPTTAILNVRQKLQDKGLTAFDPKHVKKENAVTASINSSLELLSGNEKFVLFHIVTGIGIGSCVLKAHIFKISNVSSEVFEISINELWSHGLISFGNMTLPPNIVAIPCIEIHEIIAQYIIEEMPYDYHLFLSKVNVDDSYEDLFTYIGDEIGDRGKIIDTSSCNMLFLTAINVLIFPCLIRTLAVTTRAVQIEVSVALDSLIESYNEVLKSNALTKYFKRRQSLAQIYGCIKDNCRMMQSMLSNKRYDEAAAWIAEYVDNHPCTVQLKGIQTLGNELTDECKHDSELVNMINETILTLGRDIEDFRPFLISLIHLHKLLSEMIEAEATNEEVEEVWDKFFDT